ncbi:MAG: multidrug effflux MFS transporter [Burkholderiales bacterium]|nr:multidrug effflux MFS transporter [Burkholderiales bacterium]MCE7876366.1 Bcr/CflA family efflux MFS transporter [Betaproteobacteria bacterium PRO3]
MTAPRTEAPGPPVATRTWSFAALLGALVMLGPFSIDLYLPAFATIGAAFDVPQVAVQATLSTYLFAYAFMMLWHGALSDALGRRAVVLGSLVVYAVATLGCAIAGNIESLWLARALQGLSAGAGLVIGRAIIRDRFHGPDAQRLMAQVTLVFSIAPAVAPVVGGLLLNALGWRSMFWALLAFTLGLFAWTARALPETHPPAARTPLHPRTLARNYRNVAGHAGFLMLGLVPALNFCAFFIYIAGAPSFLVDLLGVSTMGFGWLFIPLIAGVMIGASASGRLAGRISPAKTVRTGFLFMGAAAAANVLVSAFAPAQVALNIAPLFFFMIGSAMSTPTIMVMLLDLFPAMRGLASSLQGFVQFALGGLVAGTVAPILDRSLLALALGMAAFCATSWTLWVVQQRRTHVVPSSSPTDDR